MRLKFKDRPVRTGGIMQTLLMVSVVLITLAVVAQAGVLVAMYLMSRRLADKAESMMNESRKIMAPLESVTNNLKAVADDLGRTGQVAREQALHIQEIVSETQQSIRGQVAEVRTAVRDTIDEARAVVMRPIRHYSAIAVGISEGIRTFLFGRTRHKDTNVRVDPEHPAA
jgi:flagellar basal body-associated protein FliL